MMPTPDEVERAWATVGQRPEAEVLKAYLFQKIVQSAPVGADFSALQRIEAERTVARVILSQMGVNLDDPGPEQVERTAAGLGAARTAARRSAAAGRTAGASRRRGV